MTKISEMIETQIVNCQTLLQVFLKERQFYLDKDELKMEDVTKILLKKMTFISKLDELKKIVKLSQNHNVNDNGIEGKKKRSLVRELGELLEQLLVIEHENELLFRKLLNDSKTRSNDQGTNGRKQTHTEAAPKGATNDDSSRRIRTPYHSRGTLTNYTETTAKGYSKNIINYA